MTCLLWFLLLFQEIDRLRAQLQEKQQNGNVDSIVEEENSLPKVHIIIEPTL